MENRRNRFCLPFSPPTFPNALIPTAYLDLLAMKRETKLLRPLKGGADFRLTFRHRNPEIMYYGIYTVMLSINAARV